MRFSAAIARRLIKISDRISERSPRKAGGPAINWKRFIDIAILASFGILAGVQIGHAGTVTVLSSSDFTADTTGQVTTNFNGVAPLPFGDGTCPASGACFAGFNPLPVNGISFSTTAGAFVNVDSAHYYGPSDLPNQYIVNSSSPSNPDFTLTITLPNPVTAFGLDYGTLFFSSSATFGLSNGFSTTISPTLPNFQTQFLGFISTDPFSSITLTVPTDASWVVEDVTTASATPLPAALPLFATGLGVMGWLARRRKRKASAVLAAA